MQILTTPNPFLKHKAKAVRAWDKKTIKEVKEMELILKAAHDPEGVGLAATQVGLDKAFFILHDKKKAITKIYINPKVTKKSEKMLSDVYKKKKNRWLEGCLSVPKIWGFVDRPFTVTIEYQRPVTLEVVTEEFTDVEAAYMQHEIDHLNGIIFTDHILAQKGQMLLETEDGLTPVSL